MRKVVVGLLLTFTIVLVLAANVYAAEPYVVRKLSNSTDPGPYEGIFYGYVNTNSGRRAPIALVLVHQGDDVQGKVYLGEGLYVDAGICGGANVPSGVQFVQGSTDPKNPNKLSTTLEFNVSGYNVTVDFHSQVTDNGSAIEAEAQIDLPWICGRDPILKGELSRIN
jgi:hypothetical protein